jgi:hypothetical protein
VTEHELEEAYARVEATEAEAISVAVRHVAMHAPFVDAPLVTIDRDLGDFQRIAATRVVTKAELMKMAEKNLSRYVGLLRPRTAIYPQLTAVRLSVLAHVALSIRLKPLLESHALWSAIDRERWDDAADELIMTKWPEKAKEEDERRRVLELARMMRTGKEPDAWAH